jgi:hypothetical protein
MLLDQKTQTEMPLPKEGEWNLSVAISPFRPAAGLGTGALMLQRTV